MNAPDDPRARVDQLIALADQLAQQPVPPRRTPWKLIIGGVVALAAVIGVVVVVTSGDDHTSSAATSTAPAVSTPAATATTAPTTEPPTTAPSATVAPVPVTTHPPTTAPTTTHAATTTTATATTGQPVRWAEYSGGKVYLDGVVPDQATADIVIKKAGAVVGPQNVVVRYKVVRGAPRPNSAPLYVRDSVLFPPGSIDIDATAKGVLDLGVALMSQNPKITIDIKGYTDSVGSPEANLALSQARVDAIFAYLVAHNVDATRLTTKAFGEADPVADNGTPEGRALNRRVEFQVNDLLG